MQLIFEPRDSPIKARREAERHWSVPPARYPTAKCIMVTPPEA